MKVKSYWLLLALPYLIHFLGVACNQAAVHANGGLMPVLFPHHSCMVEALKGDLTHTCMTAQTHLKFLADWIMGQEDVESIGDKLLMFGQEIKYPSFAAWALLAIREVFVKKYSIER